MKKLLLASALAATVASSAFADNDAFYVRLDAGASMMPKSTVVPGIKSKFSTHAVAGVGVGVYVMDNVRTELDFGYHFNPEQKATKNGTSAKNKLTAYTVNLKALVDVYDFGMGQLFAGAGIGLSSVGGKQTLSSAGTTVTNKFKSKMNFDWLATAGVAFDVAEGVKADLAYSYNDLGKTKNKAGSNTKAARFTSHDVVAGIRVEL